MPEARQTYEGQHRDLDDVGEQGLEGRAAGRAEAHAVEHGLDVGVLVDVLEALLKAP